MNGTIKNNALLLAVLTALAPATSLAQSNESKGTFNFLVENDIYTGTDQHYTSGVQFSYLSGRDDLPGWLRTTAGALPGIADGAHLRAGFQLGHSIYTPDDIKTRELQPNDRPYAGWLYGGVAVVGETDDRLDTWMLNLGIVGPSARGEDIQNGIHDLIGSDEANGWNNQIEDEFGYALLYERRWRNLWEYERTGYGVDFNPHVGFSLGNVATYVNGGATVRLGNDLTNDFGPPRIRPSLPGSAYFEQRDDFGWYLFAGVDVRAVGYNIFLDGNTHKDGHDVDKEPIVADAQAGLVMTIDDWRLAYTYVYRTEEYEGQDKPDRFGSLSVSFHY